MSASHSQSGRKKKRKTPTGYRIQSRNHAVNVMIIIPLALLYEAMGFFINLGHPTELRNGADVIMRQFFLVFGPWAQLAYAVSLLLILLAIVIPNRQLLTSGKIQPNVLYLMVAESGAWAVLLLLMLSFGGTWLLSLSGSMSILQNIYLAMGAGIFEEILFRFLGISGLLFLFRKVFSWNKTLSLIGAVIVSSAIFSGFHYIGPYGDPFQWLSFSVRLLAGIYLSIIFLFRGLGISVYTHFIYDLILVVA